MLSHTQLPARHVPAAVARCFPVALAALCAGILIASFYKSDLAHNNFQRLENLPLLFVFFGLFTGLCGVYVGVYVERRPVSDRALVTTTVVCALLSLASFPMGSKDVLAYAFLGRMLGHYHVNPFLIAPAQFGADPWLHVADGALSRPVSSYGPLFMLQVWLVDAVAGRSLWLAVWAHKALATLLLFATLLVARALLRRTAPVPTAPALLVLLAWNPLFLFEAAGGGHNDIAMVLLLLASLWCWRADRHYTALVLLVLSFWYKLFSLIFVPIFLIDTFKTSGFRAAFREVLVCGAAGLLCGVILLEPLPGAFTVIIGGLVHPEKLQGVFPHEISPLLAALYWTLRAAGLFSTDLGFRIFDVTRVGMFAVAVLAIFLRQWRSEPGWAAVAENSFLIGLALFVLLITQLWPWHLLTIIALGVVCGREPFVLAAVVATVLALLSYFLTFAVSTLMFIMLVVALWLMRRFGPEPA